MLAGNETLSGWTASPQGRGTFDIVLTCILTIILCCWTTVCPNVPALTDGRWAQFCDKFDLACIGLLGPEFLLGIALGQRSSASRSVQKFKQLKGKYPPWTLTHAFFADMGGFVLEAPDLSFPIPLDAEQIFYLVENKYIDYPAIDEEEIRDKNKADGLARLLTVCQALWFLTSSIARPIQGLRMTTLELTTISFIIVMFATSYSWFHKPSDISRPITLQCNTTISHIRNEAGLRGLSDEYRSTPLDFINDDEYVMHLIWDHYINLLQRLHIPLFTRRITTRPHNRNRGDRFLKTALNFEFFAGIVIIPFSATFICAWNFYFPSEAERILWRTASVFFFFFGAIGGSYTWMWHLMLFEKYKQNARVSRIDASAAHLHRGKATPAGSTIPLPKSLIWPVSFLCFFHCLFRTYIFVEDIISLRSLPESVFSSVNWSLYLPHI